METQKDKFSKLKVDDETQILLRQHTIFNGYDVMMESWIWDGIAGQSVIFDKNDIENIDDEYLIQMIKEHYETQTVTVSRTNADYVFLNFNFMETK